MPVNLTNNDISTRYALQEDFNNGFVGRDRQVVIQTDDAKGYRPVIMDGATQGGKSKVALLADLTDYVPNSTYNTDKATLAPLNAPALTGNATLNGSPIATEEDINSLQTQIKQIVLGIFFPVGSIYMDATGSVNPNTAFGGTWVKIENRFLLASGSRAVGATGGEENVILNSNQIPSHNHGSRGSMNIVGKIGGSRTMGEISMEGAFYLTNEAHTSSSVFGLTDTSFGESYRSTKITLDASRNWSGTGGSAGGGQAHNNMPPYQVVAIWKRTA